MEHTRGKWTNRMTFILAAIGSSVGLGNAWRFPGLCAKHGGGAFLFAYLIIMLLFGIPLLMMEIAIGRRIKKGAPEAMRGMNKKLEPVGWAATTNAFFIVIYYAVVFAWVIMMAILSFKFINITGDNVAAAKVWETAIGKKSAFTGFDNISTIVLVCILAAWVIMFLCIKNGAQTVGKVVKYTVTLPIICLLIMAVKGLTMSGALEGIKVLFVPDFSAWGNTALWVDAAGQVFYSLSIMMAIMIAYGSFLKEDSNVAVDSIIIAFSDFFTSLLSGIVLFTTLYGVGSTVNDMSDSGIATAFLIYPTAIVNLTESGIANGIFAFIFYFCLCTLAIDSAFSIVEGISTAVSDKFILDRKKTTLVICIVAGLLSLTMATGAGVAILDTMDHWCNYYNLIIIGIFECIGIGWLFKPSKILDEINKNTKKFKMPAWWFISAVKFIAPLVLIGLLVATPIFDIKQSGNFIYGYKDGYTALSNIICGWLLTVLTIASGFIVKLIVKRLKKKGYKEPEVTWEDSKSNEK